MEAPTAGGELVELSRLVESRIPEILARWERAARAIAPARRLSPPALRDDVASLIARIAAVIRTGDARLLDEVPEAHALERLAEGFDLGAVVAELQALRGAILDTFRAEVSPVIDVQAAARLDAAVDAVVSASVARFVAARERTLAALDRLTAAALGTGDLDTFLPRLIRILRETTDAVDSVVILLREGDQLRVRAADGLDLKGQGFSLTVGESFAGTIAGSREPAVLDPRTEKRPFREREAIRRNGLRVLYGVPLLHDGDVLGVAHMGSRSALDFSAIDRQLFRTMAQRAISLIVQARMREREREAHRRLSAATEALRVSEERMRRALSIESVGVLYFTLDGAILDANPTLERMSGYRVEELRALPWWVLTPAEFIPATERVHEALTTRGTTPPYEKQWIRPDGSRWWGLFAPTRVQGQECVEIIIDVSDRKRAEDVLRRTAAFREQFLGVIGHDLKNPLAAIRASAELMMRRGLDEGQRRLVQRIAETTDRTQRMIGDLLDFTQGRLGGGIPVHLQRTNLHDVVSRVVDELRVAQPGRKVEVTVHGDPWGIWDAERLAQLASNLIGNALQHGSEDNPARVAVVDEREAVLLRVANRGDPIPAALLPVLFEPFRGTASSAEGGVRRSLGLGLWIVREIARAHGATVDVRSTEAEGTVFDVRLPRRPPGATAG